jgi:hypothetical protein
MDRLVDLLIKYARYGPWAALLGSPDTDFTIGQRFRTSAAGRPACHSTFLVRGSKHMSDRFQFPSQVVS